MSLAPPRIGTPRRCARCGRSRSRCPRAGRSAVRSSLALGIVRRALEQDQHVDVRVGKELAAAVAADGDQRPCCWRRALCGRAGCSSASMQRARPCSSSFRPGFARLEPRDQLAALQSQAVPQLEADIVHVTRWQARRQARRWLRRSRNAAAPVSRRGTREHLVAGLGHQHRVLPLRRQAVVLGDDGPAVGQFADAGACRR